MTEIAGVLHCPSCNTCSSLATKQFPIADVLPNETVDLSVRLLQAEHCHTSGTLDAISMDPLVRVVPCNVRLSGRNAYESIYCRQSAITRDRKNAYCCQCHACPSMFGREGCQRLVAINLKRIFNNEQDEDFSKLYTGSTLHCLLPIPRI
jgi:hypothetical protein